MITGLSLHILGAKPSDWPIFGVPLYHGLVNFNVLFRLSLLLSLLLLVTVWHATALIGATLVSFRQLSYLLLCPRHSSRLHPLYRLFHGGPRTYRVSHLVSVDSDLFRQQILVGLWLGRVFLPVKVFGKTIVLLFKDSLCHVQIWCYAAIVPRGITPHSTILHTAVDQ